MKISDSYLFSLSLSKTNNNEIKKEVADYFVTKEVFKDSETNTQEESKITSINFNLKEAKYVKFELDSDEILEFDLVDDKDNKVFIFQGEDAKEMYYCDKGGFENDNDIDSTDELLKGNIRKINEIRGNNIERLRLNRDSRIHMQIQEEENESQI